MKRWILVVLLAAVLPLEAQRHKLGTINAETPEGEALQAIGVETDEAKKLALLEAFAGKFEKHEGYPWVLAQMHILYAKANQHEKVLAVGEKLLALDPEDAQTAHNTLKAAEALKDSDLVRTWAVKTSETARKAAAAKKPEDEDEVAEWTASVDFAKQLDKYTEYSLYATALQTTDPAKRIALAETLEQRNAESEYLPQVYPLWFLAYRQANDSEKAVALGEKLFEKNLANEDMLLVMADYYMQTKKEPEKVLTYSAKMLEVVEGKSAPEGVSAEEWEKKKKATMGLGHWMAGVTHSGQNRFAQADKSLRAALPLVEDNPQLLAPTLFYLGLANFRLGDAGKGDTQRILDALRFNQRCAEMKSPFQGQAQQNIKAIRAKYAVR